jgi:hypothetical protein
MFCDVKAEVLKSASDPFSVTEEHPDRMDDALKSAGDSNSSTI